MASANIKGYQNVHNHFEECLFGVQNQFYDFCELRINVVFVFIGFDKESFHVLCIIKRCLIYFFRDQVKNTVVQYTTSWRWSVQVHILERSHINNFTLWIIEFIIELHGDYQNCCYLYQGNHDCKKQIPTGSAFLSTIFFSEPFSLIETDTGRNHVYVMCQFHLIFL